MNQAKPADTWNAAQYNRFADHRLKPALDLIEAVPLDGPSSIVDLGCGPGTVTLLLAERWPGARIVGVDGSADMLATARVNDLDGGIDWIEADIGAWRPSGEDLVFSNAALHWLDDHESLLGGWLDAMPSGAVLAFQVPDNFAQPSHEVMRAVAGDPRWRDRLADVAGRRPVARPERYREWLGAHATRAEVWHTIYEQVLSGPDPVFEWLKGAGMRPYLALLDDAEQGAFETLCREKLADAYPAGSDGTTVFPFRRLFAIAVR